MVDGSLPSGKKCTHPPSFTSLRQYSNPRWYTPKPVFKRFLEWDSRALCCDSLTSGDWDQLCSGEYPGKKWIGEHKFTCSWSPGNWVCLQWNLKMTSTISSSLRTALSKMAECLFTNDDNTKTFTEGLKFLPHMTGSSRHEAWLLTVTRGCPFGRWLTAFMSLPKFLVWTLWAVPMGINTSGKHICALILQLLIAGQLENHTLKALKNIGTLQLVCKQTLRHEARLLTQNGFCEQSNQELHAAWTQSPWGRQPVRRNTSRPSWIPHFRV